MVWQMWHLNRAVPAAAPQVRAAQAAAAPLAVLRAVVPAVAHLLLQAAQAHPAVLQQETHVTIIWYSMIRIGHGNIPAQ